ncbi:unnamed protein product [Pleuronectes platessa]|uniref:HMA domain-containing protein n=1 Tax=Pleuronectes platessa TaxID=8262 RepID=A0A9N7VEV9_PLEPL|nr:unnamed protein product [Pleuronectes platessa]
MQCSSCVSVIEQFLVTLSSRHKWEQFDDITSHGEASGKAALALPLTSGIVLMRVVAGSPRRPESPYNSHCCNSLMTRHTGK